MLLSEVYIYKTESNKILNFNKTVNTQDDSDWEEIQN